MACIGIAPEENDLGLRNIYVLDVMEGDWNLDEAYDALIGMYWRHRPNLVAAERQGMSVFASQVRRRMEARGSHIRIDDLKPANRSKDSRVQTFAPYVKNQMVYVLKDIPRIQETVVEQLKRFPKSRYRDVADVLGYIEDIVQDYGYMINTGGQPRKKRERPVYKRVAGALT
jgi:predicted phage terminase large subunit-like protein